VPLDPELPDLSQIPSAPLTEALGTDALGAQAMEHSSPHSPSHLHCENCGAKLQGPFCHRCGQHDFDINRSFIHTFFEALENFFHFDTKLFRNLITLLFQPGRMTVDFNAGKRASQVPPFRLYVFVSILFFFLTFLQTEKTAPTFNTKFNQGSNAGFTIDGEPVSVMEAWDAAIEKNDHNADAKKALESARNLTDEIKEEIATKIAEADPNTTIEEEKSEFERKIEAKSKKLTSPEGQRQMFHSFLGAMPKLVLICLPFFALYTRFLFRKSKQVYLQHLVVALHFHTFVFIWLMTRDGWEFLASFASASVAENISLACNVWLVLYPLLMFRHIFANSWFKTTLKTIVLGFAYLLTLVFGFAVTAVIILWAL
jgi:hypothetical protein